ncbi:hypothetical protein BJY04DRAFT_23458 [Aspergillus karnatakaensis]|uniref:Myb-like DNA-binding domain protein n=1 Tax=Aspergillus karnatakaensis TaxID=1810916 RepID=UPI003CCCEDBB
MEGPSKRKRLSPSPEGDDEPSDVDLHEARAQNDLRLKSIFEGIFEKYGRDFTDVGDEIDLQTGDILVNNGHLHALEEGRNPEALGDIGDWLSDDPDSQDRSNEQPENTEGDPLRGRPHKRESDDGVREENGDHPGRRRVTSILSQLLPENRRETLDGDEDGSASEAEDDRSSLDSLLDTALCIQDTRSQEVGTGEATSEKANPVPEGFNQSQAEHNETLDETVDPIWRVPEITAKFSTPAHQLSRSRPKPAISTVRSQSPPGAGSLWALPRSSTRNTDLVKRRKQKDSPKKQKKHHSSPVVCDWSFADAPDGSESDDPLQEAYEPSPTPKRAIYIREKRKGPFSASGTKNTCSYCKMTFSQEGYVTHLRAVLSDPADSQHDLIQLKRQLDSVTGSPATEQASGATFTAKSSVRPANILKTGLDGKEGQGSNHELTPTSNKRTTHPLDPDEAKLMIQSKHFQGLDWKGIMDRFPQKKLANVRSWHHVHWNARQSNPPPLSRPWSKDELEGLQKLKDQPGLTWSEIRAEFPGRLHAEIEFKLLQIWATGNVGHPQEGPSS